MAELDSVVRWDEANRDEGLEYRKDPEARPWLMRSGEILGPVAELLGIDPSPQPMENPREYARAAMDYTVWLALGDLDRTLEVAERLLYVSEFDQPLGRISALDSLCVMCESLSIDIAESGVTPVPEAVDPGVAAQDFLRLNPEARTESLGEGQSDRYRSALLELARVSRPTAVERRQLVADLAQAWRHEPVRSLRATAADAVRRVLRHAVRAQLLDSMKLAGTESAPVRLHAMRLFRAYAGPEGVAVILATKERTAAEDEQGPFDDDAILRLELVNMCGQLPFEVAEVGFDRGEGIPRGPSPLEYLYRIVATEDVVNPSLPKVALEALSLCLGRQTFDPDPAWAHAWWAERALGGTGS